MNLQEYIELSEKTLSNEFHSDKKMEKILHAVMGSLTEIEELLDNYENEMDFQMDKSYFKQAIKEEVINVKRHRRN
jgi:hypothetical protein